MGTFFAEVHLASPSRPDRRESVKLLVDSGSMDTWVSAGALRDLGLQPSERRRVLTIEGRATERGAKRPRSPGCSHPRRIRAGDRPHPASPHSRHPLRRV